jgi:hypothetical protein
MKETVIIIKKKHLKFAIFWDIALCSPYMGLDTRSRWFLARLIFDPENGGDTFLRNVDSYTECENLKSYRVVFDSTANFQHDKSLCLVFMFNLMAMNQYRRSNVT